MLFYWLIVSNFKAQLGRWLIAGLTVALGISLAVAIHTVNRSALTEFSRAIDTINGQASAQIIMPAGEFSDRLFDEIALRQTELGIRAMSPVLERNTKLVRILGLDIFRAARVTPSLIPVVSEENQQLIFSDKVIFLSAVAMQKSHVSIGDMLPIEFDQKISLFQVVGTVPEATGQNIAVMDLGTMQWRLDGLGKISRIDIQLLDGYGIDEVSAAIKKLDLGLILISAQDRDRRASNLSRAYRINLTVLAFVALFTGAFLVFTTISFSVLRQQSQLALLYILGVSRTWVFLLVLTQASVIAALGGLLGIGMGLIFAMVLLNFVGGDLGAGYFSSVVPALEIDPLTLIGFWMLSILVGLIAGYFPAKSATSGRPATQLRAGSIERILKPVSYRRLAGVLGLSSLGLAFMPAMNDLPIAGYASIVFLLFAGLALTPWLVSYCFSLLAGIFAKKQSISPSFTFAIWRLSQAPENAAGLIAGVIAALALTVAMVVMVASFRDSMTTWLDQVLPADLYANFSQLKISDELSTNKTLLSDVPSVIQSISGIDRFEFNQQKKILFQADRPEVTLIARPIPVGREAQVLPLLGSVTRQTNNLPVSEALPEVYISEAMQDLYDWQPGKVYSLPALTESKASHNVWVAGVFRDYGRQHGSLTMDLVSYQKLSQDDRYTGIAIWLTKEAKVENVVNQLRNKIPVFSDQRFTNRSDLRAFSLTIFDRSFALTYALEIAALVVAIFAVATGFAGQALLREKEYALVFHLGQSSLQRAGWISAESGMLLALAVFWGTILGLLMSQILIHRVNPQSFHWSMDTSIPYFTLIALITVFVLSGIAAALWGSYRSLNRTTLITSLRQEW